MKPGCLSSLSEHCGGREGGGYAQHLNKKEFLPPYIPCSSVGTESTCSEGHLGSIPGLGRLPGGGHGNPLQYSCLENPMDRGAWWATVHGVAKSWTRLSDYTFTFKGTVRKEEAVPTPTPTPPTATPPALFSWGWRGLFVTQEEDPAPSASCLPVCPVETCIQCVCQCLLTRLGFTLGRGKPVVLGSKNPV